MYILSQFVQTLYEAFICLKYYNKVYKDIFIAKSLSSKVMFKISDIVQIQGPSECVKEKNVSDGNQMTEHINDKK